MTAWLSVTNNADTHATYELQTTLQTLGYPVAIDGRFGVGTSRAVVAFQRATKLEADGNCGPATWAALQKATAPKPTKKKAADDDAEAAPKAAAKKPATKGATKK
jgi:peptidoglycan hydrolase-like protein with peptidoglycan-binding domain|tara:strand:- start:140 stop:454 length:315 start_codon:yes stop_codon:yes gene_type:complete